jgi:hypothetical protein
MRPPIFHWEPNELIAFDSVESAVSATEPYDVNDGVVYDADGRLLAFDLEGPGRRWEKDVVLRECESEPTHAQDLRAVITQAADTVGTKLDQSASLEQLVRDALERHRAH